MSNATQCRDAALADQPEPGGDDLATSKPAGEIVAIDRGVVHQICSGQVVLTLATAVKELLENSLDAGATVVDIKLREMGSEMVEVSDNGYGVEQRNYKGMTVKHATSKLREFTDLFSVETFGFRGEALSSLCALSNVTISTRHKSASTGTLMTYDHHGNILTSTTQARPVGTTVTLANLFSTMPVRQKEFHRSLKREFGKLISVMSAYGLVSSGVRIMVTNSKAKGGRTVVVHTQGSDSLRENMVNIFGTKQMSTVRPFAQVDLSEEDMAKANMRLHGVLPRVSLEGFISSPVHGEGRGAPDRQFYFVNSRPCDPTKLVKLVNQVYHGYNRNQFPFVCLNIITERSTVDINITPDKRQVFLTNEKFLNELVKKSLEKMFEDAPSTMDVNTFLTKPNSMSHDQSAEVTKNKENLASQSNVKNSPKFNLSNLKRSFSSSFSSSTSPLQNSGKKQKTLQSFFKVDPSGDNEDDCDEESSFVVHRESVEESEVLNNEVEKDKESSSNNIDKEREITFDDVENETNQELDDCGGKGDIGVIGNDSAKIESNGLTLIFDDYSTMKSQSLPEKGAEIKAGNVSIVIDDFTSISQKKVGEEVKNPGLNIIFDDFVDHKEISLKKSPKCENSKPSNVGEGFKITFDKFDANDKIDVPVPRKKPNSNEVTVVVEDDEALEDKSRTFKKKEVKASFNFDSLVISLKEMEKSESDLKCLKFKAQIKTSDNKNAEAELQKQIQKTDFAEMEIFGQFNLGFLITGLKSDLFIIDQHATDEKYNFETLQKTTVIKSQKMVVPQKLELTSVNESILIDNLPVFEKNGFHFKIDENAPTTEKVSLTSLPISKNWTFGKEDIDELIFMLSEAGEDSSEHFRPSRVRAMFASRACRTSVMVGTSLSMGDMDRLVRHMGEIEQPWNCPHGRPTIRHLVNTEMVRL
eukprot:TRINITY_DN32913_c0_g1_i1.p1 TRINITY_DN32913_c0_g1~~TRINITY_DN32913_c0_g1_i1.p1  ORF type:complete len:926 (-),score=337.38 TRINITY_DN32913_c0_g1_i1:128-2905(-)